jgi:hypothetical protein
MEAGAPEEADDVPMPPAPVVDPAAYIRGNANVAQVNATIAR